MFPVQKEKVKIKRSRGKHSGTAAAFAASALILLPAAAVFCGRTYPFIEKSMTAVVLEMCKNDAQIKQDAELLFSGIKTDRRDKTLIPATDDAKNDLMPGLSGILKTVSDGQNESKPEYTAKASDLSAENISSIFNETSYNISVEDIRNNDFKIENDIAVSAGTFGENINEESPLVLIIHTHGTECYADAGSDTFRTQNTDENVVRVGDELEKELIGKGISVIHCRNMFDKDSYIYAYSNSNEAVSEYLSQNPSIKVVIDLHRDALSDGNGGYRKVITDVNGQNVAQLMFVIGTDEAGANHPDWRNNLKAAYDIQLDVCEKYPTLMRPIYLRKASFNQQLLPGYFILEAGSCGNTLDEVLPSVRMFADVLAQTIGNSTEVK